MRPPHEGTPMHKYQRSALPFNPWKEDDKITIHVYLTFNVKKDLANDVSPSDQLGSTA
ncbi:hypothetical protein NC652_018839 [Populus alba x Populus x berolinensis]|uniref:Uncharacterized protein n=1 Tax=Populus alba x Populus x berolinensis TaxID=444605 RepID=A0AAD6VVY6_9ROSI|nr:hypothetical protein NC652_018839 [Populus alba x Populus x berolinensis]KAJ6990243.1 hypothetical protein NC653_018705 [Populus alba x Populus x berolinensis]